jgi:phenylacetate-coenzyme A ligase PaaK-like adenylate-forming protein
MAGLLTKLRWNALLAWHTRRERSLPFRPIEDIEAIQSRRVRAKVAHANANDPFSRDASAQRGLKPRDLQSAADHSHLP